VVKRVARVVPLFLLVVLFSYILQTNGIKRVLYNIPDTSSLISHIALLSGISVLWTIPPEIQFYALFIFLWWIMAKREKLLYIFLASVFLSIVVLNFPRPTGDVLGLHYDISLLQALPYFISGVVFGQLYSRWKPPARLSSGYFVLALLIIPLLYPKIFASLVGQRHRMWEELGVWFAVSLVFFLIVFFVPDDNRLLSNRFGDFIGKISYSLYLLHLPVLHQLKETARQQPAVFLVVFIIAAMIVSYISFLLIENPSRKAIRSIISNKRMHPDASLVTPHARQ
jgi:peptidoglycan/LPS O-acetylase OafA/YrhL